MDTIKQDSCISMDMKPALFAKTPETLEQILSNASLSSPLNASPRRSSFGVEAEKQGTFARRISLFAPNNKKKPDSINIAKDDERNEKEETKEEIKKSI